MGADPERLVGHLKVLYKPSIPEQPSPIPPEVSVRAREHRVVELGALQFKTLQS